MNDAKANCDATEYVLCSTVRFEFISNNKLVASNLYPLPHIPVDRGDCVRTLVSFVGDMGVVCELFMM